MTMIMGLCVAGIIIICVIFAAVIRCLMDGNDTFGGD